MWCVFAIFYNHHADFNNSFDKSGARNDIILRIEKKRRVEIEDGNPDEYASKKTIIFKRKDFR